MPLRFPPEFDACHSECRRRGRHSLIWGGCEHAVEPEPTVSMSKVYQDTDGYNSIGFDVYTVAQLAELIEPALRTIKIRLGPNALAMLERGEEVRLSAGEYASMALAAADAIVHRNDVCSRCKGSGVDPIHKACEDFGDFTREVDVPCIACET